MLAHAVVAELGDQLQRREARPLDLVGLHRLDVAVGPPLLGQSGHIVENALRRFADQVIEHICHAVGSRSVQREESSDAARKGLV